jgi:spore germination cell wall hydrolase CwlJ-like protein
VDAYPEGVGRELAATGTAEVQPLAPASNSQGSEMIDPTIMAVASSLYLAEPVSLSLHSAQCLADAVYHEARGLPVDAQVAVASAVLNRGEPCRAISAPGQFTYPRNRPRTDQRAWRQAAEVAVLVQSGAVPAYQVTHFHDTRVNPYWTRAMEFMGQIRNMKFWRENRR